MAAPADSILPPAFFDGLSNLWGGCAFLGSIIVVAGMVFQVVRGRPDAGAFVWILTKVFFIGLSTVFIREWLMRLNDIVFAFSAMLGIDPSKVDERFIEFIAGKAPSDPDTSVWDIIWGTESIGTAFCYAFFWLFGWLAWGIQYVIKLIGGVLLTAGWALSPVFLSFFMLRPMVGVAQKYLLGLIALVCWPLGWVMAAVVTNAMLQAAAAASLVPIVVGGAPLAVPGLTVLLVGSWIVISSFLAPWITTKILLMGANPAAAFAQGFGGVAQSAFLGGTGAAVAATAAGVTVPAVLAAATVGTVSAGTESAMRGGGSARTTTAALIGLSGLHQGRFVRRNTEAAELSASAGNRRAAAAETMASIFSQHARSMRQSRSGFDQQPHEDDPNKAALEI